MSAFALIRPIPNLIKQQSAPVDTCYLLSVFSTFNGYGWVRCDRPSSRSYFASLPMRLAVASVRAQLWYRQGCFTTRKTLLSRAISLFNVSRNVGRILSLLPCFKSAVGETPGLELSRCTPSETLNQVRHFRDRYSPPRRINFGCAARGGRIPAVVFDRRATKHPAKICAALRVGAAPGRVAGSLNRTSAIHQRLESSAALPIRRGGLYRSRKWCTSPPLRRVEISMGFGFIT
jgi:hypothetical protein